MAFHYVYHPRESAWSKQTARKQFRVLYFIIAEIDDAIAARCADGQERCITSVQVNAFGPIQQGTLAHYAGTAGQGAFVVRRTRWLSNYQLATAGERASLREALRLSELEPTPTLDAFQEIESARPRCVITDQDRVVGFFDATLDPFETRTDTEKKVALEKLAQKGIHLFEKLLPADLRQQLWELRKRIRVVQVVSSETWIPWELLKLSGTGARAHGGRPLFLRGFYNDALGNRRVIVSDFFHLRFWPQRNIPRDQLT